MPAQCQAYHVSRNEWDALLSEYDYPLYYASWWLEEASCGAVRYLVVYCEGQPIAILAYIYQYREILMPPYCQYTGVHYLARGLSLSQQQEAEQAMLLALPRHNFLHLHYAPSSTDFLAAYWLGYKQTLRYNYVLDLKKFSSASDFVSSIAKSLRRNYKASSRLPLVYDRLVQSDELLAFLARTAQDKGYKAQLTILKLLIQVAEREGVARLVALREPESNALVIAALFVEHKRRAYLIAEGTDRSLASKYQLKTLLLEHYILEVFDTIDEVDFEGSMIKPIAQIYQGYRAVREPYHSIRRGYRSWFSRILCRLYTHQ